MQRCIDDLLAFSTITSRIFIFNEGFGCWSIYTNTFQVFTYDNSACPSSRMFISSSSIFRQKSKSSFSLRFKKTFSDIRSSVLATICTNLWRLKCCTLASRVSEISREVRFMIWHTTQPIFPPSIYLCCIQYIPARAFLYQVFFRYHQSIEDANACHFFHGFI